MKKIIVISTALVLILLSAAIALLFVEEEKWQEGIFFRPEVSYIGHTDTQGMTYEFKLYAVENAKVDFIDATVSDIFLVGDQSQKLKVSSFTLNEVEAAKQYKLYRLNTNFTFEQEQRKTLKSIEFINRQTGAVKKFEVGNIVLDYKKTKEQPPELVWGYSNILDKSNEYKFTIENKADRAVKIENIHFENQQFTDVPTKQEYVVAPKTKKEIVVRFPNTAKQYDIVRFRPIVEYRFEDQADEVYYSTMVVSAVYEKAIAPEVLNDYLSKR